jgi:hypothetical protein
MADNTLASWAPFLYEMKGKVVEVFPSEAPFLAEMSGYDAHMGMVDHASAVQRLTREMDGGRDVFSGKSVRHTIIPAGLTGGGNVTEQSGGGPSSVTQWNVPHALQDAQININLVRFLVPFSVTVDVERDSFDNASATAVATLVQQARTALARLENLEFLGDGTGKVSDITGGTSPGLTIQVGAAGNFDVLLPGTVWDIRTKSTGAATSGGNVRRVVSTANEGLSTATVTFDTNAFADGDSGNITFSTNEGIYIEKSWSNAGSGAYAPGNLAAQGLEQAAATSGTFETLDKANTFWQGTDGRGGDTSVVALSQTMLDGAIRRGRRSGLGAWDFALGDPAVIDAYKQSLYSLVRYEPDQTTLKSGYSGIAYDGADRPFPLIKEPMHKKSGLKLIDKNSFQLYGDQPGPSFLEDDGSMFRRFARTLPKEAELLDRVQLGVTKCNTIVFLNNLLQAA